MILVTGGHGMLGKALRKVLPDAYYASRLDANLESYHDTINLFDEVRPDTVIHLAAKVGGIKANIKQPYDFIASNLAINQNVIDRCVYHKCRLIAASSTCVYPAVCSQYPMTENMVDDGPPHWTNAPYAIAKRTMQMAIDAAERQYGLQGAVLYLSNMYGPHDNFDPKTAHLVPALIAKMHAGENPLRLMGDGTPMREFTYVDDVAAVVVRLLQHLEPLWMNGMRSILRFNVTTPESHSIQDIVSMAADASGYTGGIHWGDAVAQNGTNIKTASGESLRRFIGDVAWTPLADGLAKTVEWYRENKCCQTC